MCATSLASLISLILPALSAVSCGAILARPSDSSEFGLTVMGIIKPEDEEDHDDYKQGPAPMGPIRAARAAKRAAAAAAAAAATKDNPIDLLGDDDDETGNLQTGKKPKIAAPEID